MQLFLLYYLLDQNSLPIKENHEYLRESKIFQMNTECSRNHFSLSSWSKAVWFTCVDNTGLILVLFLVNVTPVRWAITDRDELQSFLNQRLQIAHGAEWCNSLSWLLFISVFSFPHHSHSHYMLSVPSLSAELDSEACRRSDMQKRLRHLLLNILWN